MTSLANTFEPSIRAAAREGPKTLRSASKKHSAIPPTRGSSGPTTVRSITVSLAKSRKEIRSSAGMSTSSAIGVIPGLPGAAKISGSSGLCARASTSACSRPPLPTTSTRTALGLYHLDNCLVPFGADAYHTQGCPDLVLDESYEVSSLFGQLLSPPATPDIDTPAGERLVYRTGVVEVGLVHGELVQPLPIYLIPHAHPHLIERREHVYHCQGEPVYAIQRSRVLDSHEVDRKSTRLN